MFPLCVSPVGKPVIVRLPPLPVVGSAGKPVGRAAVRRLVAGVLADVEYARSRVAIRHEREFLDHEVIQFHGDFEVAAQTPINDEFVIFAIVRVCDMQDEGNGRVIDMGGIDGFALIWSSCRACGNGAAPQHGQRGGPQLGVLGGAGNFALRPARPRRPRENPARAIP